MSALDVLRIWHGIQSAKAEFMAASDEERAVIVRNVLASVETKSAQVIAALPPVAAVKAAELLDALREWR